MHISLNKGEPAVFYILVDTETESRCMTFDSFSKAQAAYYQQWRAADGSIPWKIIYGEYAVDPMTGNVSRADQLCR
jgi:hypothetical protein